MASLAIVAGACFAVGYTASHMKISSSASAGVTSFATNSAQAAKATNGISAVFTNRRTDARKPIYSSDMYDEVVEPHIVTTMTVTDLNSDVEAVDIRYVWLIDGEELGRGSAIDHTFHQTGDSTVVLQKQYVTPKSTTLLEDVTIRVAVRYVRREIRALSDEDRTQFFDAVKMLNEVSMDEGTLVYGPNYRDKDYFGRLHLKYGGDPDCDHWHDGSGFMITHTALTLEFERALQTVFPSTSVPYWDYSLESTFYTVADWRTSKVFSDDWFGEAAPKNSLHTVTSGRWAYVPMRTEAWDYSAYTNSFGVMRGPWNNDPTPYVTRTDTIAGYPNNLKPRGCGGFNKCLRYNSWSNLAACLNTDAHGHIHELIGGSYGGDWDHREGSNTSYYYVGSEIFSEPYNLMHLALFMSKDLWRNKLMTCPDYCAMDTPGSDCACTCDADILDSQTPYETLYQSGALARLFFFDMDKSHMRRRFDSETNRTEYYLQNRTQAQQDHLWWALRKNLCSIGYTGDMYSASSPNDVTFWVLHPTIERLWHWIRHSSNETTFSDVWSTSTCSGHNANDVQPWTAELFGLSDSSYLTNSELYDLMHPATGALPYVYDNFEWAHCEARGFSMEFSGHEDTYTADTFFD